MILSSQPKQFRLQDDGQILWQADATNPLPGIPVAIIRKGESALKPAVELLPADILAELDKSAVLEFITAWLHQHIGTILATLVGLVKEDGIEGPAKEISEKVYEALGIIQRQDIETQIAALDADARKVLRLRHVRLGPVLVFVPELNKPAAVRLRALLWWLWNDRVLPAPVPKDGVVSVIVNESDIDPVYQRAIGYPVYGSRAIRVDMLDRLISAVYDSAKDGAFKATHTMAEWLGTPIADLYKVLEAMGHKKTYDPAENPPAEQPKPTEEAVAPAAITETPPTDEVKPDSAKPEPVKPELATFRLKRGKASEAERPRPPRAAKKPVTPPPFEKLTEEEIKERALRAEKRQADRKPKPRDHNKKPREDKNVFTMEARPAQQGESPFAMLQQLKTGKKD